MPTSLLSLTHCLEDLEESSTISGPGFILNLNVKPILIFCLLACPRRLSPPRSDFVCLNNVMCKVARLGSFLKAQLDVMMGDPWLALLQVLQGLFSSVGKVAGVEGIQVKTKFSTGTGLAFASGSSYAANVV